jgi:hypothetical protein
MVYTLLRPQAMLELSFGCRLRPAAARRAVAPSGGYGKARQTLNEVSSPDRGDVGRAPEMLMPPANRNGGLRSHVRFDSEDVGSTPSPPAPRSVNPSADGDRVRGFPSISSLSAIMLERTLRG